MTKDASASDVSCDAASTHTLVKDDVSSADEPTNGGGEIAEELAADEDACMCVRSEGNLAAEVNKFTDGAREGLPPLTVLSGEDEGTEGGGEENEDSTGDGTRPQLSAEPIPSSRAKTSAYSKELKGGAQPSQLERTS